MNKFLSVFCFLLFISWFNNIYAQAPAVTYAGPKSYVAGTAITTLIPSNAGGKVPGTFYGQTSTFASGTGFGSISGIVADTAYNIYIADASYNVIRKITPAGSVSIFAGSGYAGFANGTGTAAVFSGPQGLAIDAAGNLYVTESGNNRIRKITPYGIVSTFAGTGAAGNADGKTTAATFSGLTGIAVDINGNVYVAENQNNDIRKINVAGTVNTLASGGVFSGLQGIAVDGAGNVYAANANGNQVLKVNQAGNVTTLAGSGASGSLDGTGIAATFTTPYGVAIDALGNIYVADAGNYLVRKITPAGLVTTLAGGGPHGANGTGNSAGFGYTTGIALDGLGGVYIADGAVRKISSIGYYLSPNLPAGLTFDVATGAISGTPLLATAAANYTIAAYNLSGSSTTNLNITVTGNIVSPVNPVVAPAISYTSPKVYTAGTTIAALTPSNTGGAIPAVLYGQTTTLAAGFGRSFNIAMDNSGNVYYADYDYNVIRKVTQAGISYIFAGTGSAGSADGVGTAAGFNQPQGMVFDALGNMYLADANNNKIRKITPSGTVTTFAGTGAAGNVDGLVANANFNHPVALAIDAYGNIYVADFGDNYIRKISSSGIVTTMAGNGTAAYADGAGSSAMFNQPNGIVVDGSANLYVADSYNHVIRKIDPMGVVTTIAGTAGLTGAVNGNSTTASFNYPFGLARDAAGNLYVADDYNNLIRKITPAGIVSTLAGSGANSSSGGTATFATFSQPAGICIDAAGNLFISGPGGDGAIRKVSAVGYSVAKALPVGLTFDATTGSIVGTPTLATAAANYLISGYNLGGSSTATVNITVTGAIVPPVNPVAAPKLSYATPKSYVAGTAISTLSPTNTGGAVPGMLYGQTTTFASNAGNSWGIISDASGNIYYADNSSHVIRKFTPAGVGSIFAGAGYAGYADGTGTGAVFNNPQGLAFDAAGNLYVGDFGNNVIRKITPAGVVSTFAGSGAAAKNDGPGAMAGFNGPGNITIDNYGNLYVVDYNNNNIRKVSPTGIVSTLAGSGAAGYADGMGTSASFNQPTGITVDGSGNVYVSDRQNYVIRKISPAGMVKTLTGNAGSLGMTDGAAGTATFSWPQGITIDAAGNIYVADRYNQYYDDTNGVWVYPASRIRRVTPAGVVSTTAGGGNGNGTGIQAGFGSLQVLTIDAAGNLYVADDGAIRKVSAVGYSVAKALPVGLTFDATTGSIVGTPTLATSAANYQISGYNLGGSSTATVNITVTGAIVPPVNPVAAPKLSYATPKSYVAGTAISTLSPTNTGGAIPGMLYGQTTTFATNLGNSWGMAKDAAGNIYYADNSSNVIRKFTPAGVGSIFAGAGYAGYADGTGTGAVFNNPQGLAFDASGNLYVADVNNNVIRKITPSGVATTFAGSGAAAKNDGPGTVASFNAPAGIATDNYSNLYVTDYNNNSIRKVSPTGIVSTLAGSGTAGYADAAGTGASFNQPTGIAVDGSGNVYVADRQNYVIRKISPAGVASTLTGNAGSIGMTDGAAGTATFSLPQGITIDASGNLYVSDRSNQYYDGTNNVYVYPTNRIRRVTLAGVVSTVAGGGNGDGTGAQAGFGSVQSLTLDAAGNLYVADNDAIRKVSAVGYSLATALPVGLTFDATTGSITGTPTLATAAANYQISGYNLGGSSTATVNITVTGAITPPVNPVAAPKLSYATPKTYAAGTAIGTLSPTNTGGAVPGMLYGQTTTFASNAGNSWGIISDASGNIYYADNSSHVIRKFTPAGVGSIFAGAGYAGYADGTGTGAVFNNPQGLAFDAAGNLYVGDFGNNVIRKITPAGVVSTFAGSGAAAKNDGPGAMAGFNGPGNITIDNYGNLYVVDFNNNNIRKVSPTGIVSTLAGSGTAGYADGMGNSASFNQPTGIAVDGLGNVYVSDRQNYVIRKISPAGMVKTLTGNAGSLGMTDGAAGTATFSWPQGITIDAAGNIYVADRSNQYYDYNDGIGWHYFSNHIRRVTPAGVVSTIAGGGNGSTDGTGIQAGFGSVQVLTIDAAGNLYVADNDAIRKVSAVGYSVAAALPVGLTFDATTGSITGTPTLATAAANYQISGYNLGGGSTTTVNITVTGTATVPALVKAPVISYSSPAAYTSGTAISALTPANSGGAIPASVYAQVSTFAGSGAMGANNGTGLAATFNNPGSLKTDAFGNLYVADANNNLIRKISPGGVVSTIAGSGANADVDGIGSGASFSSLSGLAIDASGTIYASESQTNLIRRISPNGTVITFAGTGSVGHDDGAGTAASFNTPYALAVDAAGNVYVGDFNNNMIRKITPDGQVSTFAGNLSPGLVNDKGTNASFNGPNDMVFDATGNMYVSDYNNNVIRKITPQQDVTTFAGNGVQGNSDGAGTSASFNRPTGLAIDADGNIYVAEQGGNQIRKIAKNAVVSTLAGSLSAGFKNGIGTDASLNFPQGLGVDRQGNLYVADTHNNVIRKIALTGYVTDNAFPAGLKFDGTTGIISGTPTIPTASTGYTITGYNAGGSSTTTVTLSVTGSAVPAPVVAAPNISYSTPKSYTAGAEITALTPTNTGGAVPAQVYTQTSTVLPGYYSITGVTSDASGNLYIVSANNNQVYKINSSGIVTVFAGRGDAGSLNGKGTAATFSNPQGLVADAAGNIYVADFGNNQIRKISPSGVVSTLAGSGAPGSANGPGATATFNGPIAITIDGSGNLFVADRDNSRIRKVAPGGAVTTFAGTTAGFANGPGTSAQFSRPLGITIDAAGNLYVSDWDNSAIRKITPAGAVSTFAGGTQGFTDGIGTAATFNIPQGLAIDKAGNIYVAEGGNNSIRRITPAGVVKTLAGYTNGSGNSNNGIGTNAGFNNPDGLAIDAAGNLYITEYYGANLRKMTLSGYVLNGTLPVGLTFDSSTGAITGTPVLATAAANYGITAYNSGGSSTTNVNIAVTGAIAPIVPTISAPVISYATPQSYTAGTGITTLKPTNTGGGVPATIYGQTTTFRDGSDVQTGGSVAVDAAGNLYLAGNNQIFKITPDNAKSVFAGNGSAGSADGMGTAASFNNPSGLAIDASGNVYVSDQGNQKIRKISPSGLVSTLAGSGSVSRTDGPGAAAGFYNPQGLAVDRFGNVYVADQGNQLIRKISPLGIVSTFAGSGTAGYTNDTGTAASFSTPAGLVIDGAGNLYVSDQGNQVIRKISPSGAVSTFAGNNTQGYADGPGTSASFSNPAGMSIDPSGNIYVADSQNHMVRKVSPAGMVSTLAGNGTFGQQNGIGGSVTFYNLSSLALDASGNLYVYDYYYYYNNSIRKVSTTGYTLTGTLPAGLSFDATTGAISGTPTVAMAATDYTVTAYNGGGSSTTKVNIKVTGAIAPIVPTISAPVISYATPQSYTAGTGITTLKPGNTGGGVPATIYGQTTTFRDGSDVQTGGSVAVDAAGNLYLAGNNQIFKITPDNAKSVFAGNGSAGLADGMGTAASFNNPSGLAIDASGNVYVSDQGNQKIRKISPSGLVSTLAGSGSVSRTDGPGAAAGFYNPQGLAVDRFGNVYVADQGNQLIRKISPLGIVSTFAGSGTAGYTNDTGTAASFSTPAGLVIDGAGNLYVSDQGNQVIRKISPSGAVSTFAGNNTQGYADGPGTSASFSNPAGMSIDPSGNIYVADSQNHMVRKVSPAGMVSTLAGNGTFGQQNGIGGSVTFIICHLWRWMHQAIYTFMIIIITTITRSAKYPQRATLLLVHYLRD